MTHDPDYPTGENYPAPPGTPLWQRAADVILGDRFAVTVGVGSLVLLGVAGVAAFAHGSYIASGFLFGIASAGVAVACGGES